MAKLIVVFVLIFSTNVALSSDLKVELKLSEVHGLFVFVKALSGDLHLPQIYRDIFLQSKFNNIKSEKQIKIFKDLSLDLSYSFKGYPLSRRNRFKVESFIMRQSAYVRNIDELVERMGGILPADELNKFSNILKYFEPIYRELLWKPNYFSLKNDMEEYREMLRGKKISALFNEALLFYNSGNFVDKFVIAFYPIPLRAKMSNARSIGLFESVGVLVGEKNKKHRLGVIFHELCHGLYETQSMLFQNTLEYWFQQNSSLYTKFARNYFDEVLATSLGNGVLIERIDKIDTGKWYEDDKIDTMARNVYSEVKKYLNDKKTLDKEFIDFYIDQFFKSFPRILNEAESLFFDITLFLPSNNEAYQNVLAKIRDNINIKSFSLSIPLNHEKSLETINENQESTIFIACYLKDVSELEIFSKKMPDYFSDILDIVRTKKSGLYSFQKKERRFILFISR